MLAKAVGQLAGMLDVPPSSRASPLPHWFWDVHGNCNHPKSPVGASLLAIAVVQLAGILDLPPSSRASSLPHWFWGVHGNCNHPKSPVRAGLLAKAVGQLAGMLDVPPSSRASSLPHWFRVFTELASTTTPLWERACSRWRWFGWHRNDRHKKTPPLARRAAFSVGRFKLYA